MKVEVYSNHRRVALAMASLKSGTCEKRNVSGIGAFFRCPTTGLKIYTEGCEILVTEKVGNLPIARIFTNHPSQYEISHPRMSDYIDQIPKSVSVTV